MNMFACRFLTLRLSILFSVLLANFLSAQTSADELTEKIHYYKKKQYKFAARNHTDSASKKIIDEVINDTLNYFCVDHGFDPGSFHFVDLDGDKDLDLLFQERACSGHESETVICYMNKSGHMIWQFSTSGRISRIKEFKEIIVYKYPCCAMLTNSILKYNIGVDTVMINTCVTFFDSFLLHEKYNPGGEHFPYILPAQLKYEESFLIKEGTDINIVPKDGLGKKPYLGDNIVATTVKTATVKVFATHKDESGTKWLYCQISTDDIKGEYDHLKYFILGWVREKYCVKISIEELKK